MQAVSPGKIRSWKKITPLAFVAVALLLAIVVINPLREELEGDDGWAYARCVLYLLHTGRYHLDSWAAANMPVQIYFAAAIAKMGGYSISLLRCTTLSLFIVAVLSFYALLREFHLSRNQAAVLAVSLIASPMVLMLAFSFMSDIHFLGWLLLALWLYVRGIRRGGTFTVFLGSLATGCAIGCRQLGIAVIGGLVCSWFFSKRENRPSIGLMFAALVVPILAAGAQLRMGLQTPNFTQAYRILEQHNFLHHSVPVLLKEIFWRCSVMLQYLGMSLLPLLPLGLAFHAHGRQELRQSTLSLAIATSLISAAVIVGLSLGSSLTVTPYDFHRGVWEPLQLFWLLRYFFEPERYWMRIVDLLSIVGVVGFVWTTLQSLRELRANGRPSPQVILLMGTVVGMVVLNLAYVQLNDTYVMPFVPFAIIIFAARLRNTGSQSRALISSAVLSMAVILLLSIAMRGAFASRLAAWQSANELVNAGVQPSNINAPLQWAEYHGAFDDWIAAGAPGMKPPPLNHPKGNQGFHEAFETWVTQRGGAAQYRICYELPNDPSNEWKVIATHSYRGASFNKRLVWTLVRASAP